MKLLSLRNANTRASTTGASWRPGVKKTADRKAASPSPILAAVAELRKERDEIDRIITTLERMASR